MTIKTASVFAVCDEYGVPHTTPFPSGFAGKPNFPASKSLEACVGVSNVTFTPNGGEVDGFGTTSAQATIQCNMAAVWTYGNLGGATANVSSGNSAPSITFTLSNAGAAERDANFNVTGVAGGETVNFQVSLSATGKG